MRRVGQFVGHLSARVEPRREAAAMAVLPPRARELFASMPIADRRHALDVLAELEADGHTDQDILAAALLHDAAKGHRMRLWHRVAGVALEAIAPRLLARLADAPIDSWRYPFRLYLEHPRLSADLAVAAGCSPRSAAFIRGDAAPADRQLLQALHRADEAS